MSAALERARVHLLALACVAGLAGANVARGSHVVVAIAAVGLLGAAAGVAPRVRFALVASALLLAGWWWGSARLDGIDRSVLVADVGASGDAVVVVTAPPRRSEYEVRVAARVRSFRGRSVSEPVQLELPPGRAPPQGAILALFAHVALPERESEFDERTWLARRGIHVVLHAHEWRVVGTRAGLGGLADALRRRLVRGLDGVRGERRAVLVGIVLGEDEGLTRELRDAFRASGLYHLLAVSGQNVALLATGVFMLATLLGLPRLPTQLVALAAIGGYVLAVGWQPSVVRAGVAGVLVLAAWLVAREAERWWLMLVGAAVLLAWNPYTLLEPGFQLSFGAVTAIFLAVPPILRFLEGYPVPALLAVVVAVSTACGAATAPILWLHFGAVPLFAVIANALAAPVVGALLGLALLAALVAPVLPPAALAVASIDGWLAAYLIACARLVAALPFAQLTSGRVLLVVAGALAAAWVFARLGAPRPLRALVLLSTLAVAGAGWAAARAPEPRPPPNGLRVTFLDVGQGDGVLVEAPGARVLVDQGPPEADVAKQLRTLGIRRVNLVVLTHPQRDHVGGAAEVLRELDVDAVLDPALATTGPEQREARLEARRRRLRVVLARAGRRLAVGPLRLTILWPDGPGFRGEDPNLRAVVLLVSYRDVDVLLTADAESGVTLPLDLPVVEVLKVAHHGSADDGLPELLAQTRPAIAVVSVGLGNDYGHPAPSTLAALRGAPALAVYRTDLDGRVVVESDGERLWVDEER